MTFIQLQNKIIQTRKARSGVHNRIDYFADDVNVNVNEDYKKQGLNAPAFYYALFSNRRTTFLIYDGSSLVCSKVYL